MIIVMVSGGLGNQLFQYAFAKKMQMEGQKVYLDLETWINETKKEKWIGIRRNISLEHFNISIPCINCKKSIWKWFFYGYNRNKIEERITNFLRNCSRKEKGKYIYWVEKQGIDIEKLKSSNKNFYLNGYYQNLKYFSNIRNEILQDISLKCKVNIDDKLKYKLENSNVIAIHIRRGDYVKLGFALSIEYYQKALSYITNKVENPVFFIFSDDLAYIDEFEIDNEKYKINLDRHLTDYEELWIMSQCKHFIISNSTFSWWGAWLSKNEKKIVVAPLEWKINDVDQFIIPNDWIRI